jgi:hypothetical protein
VKRSRTPIVGRAVPAQTRLRPQTPVRTLDEFLEFLRQVYGTAGWTERPRRLTTGDRFLL